MPTNRLAPWLAALTLGMATTAAQAGELYTSVGLPGLMIGYAQPLSSRFALRADLATLGSISVDSIEEGVSYSGTVKSDRGALLMDWFVVGGMRLTGGLTFNRMSIDLRANGNGGNLTIGDTSFVTSASDRFDVSMRFPGTTPYLGLGYGHYGTSGSRFRFDLGGSIGRARISEAHSGPNLGAVSQADLDKELAQLREGIGRIRFVPQVSLGMSLKF